MKVARAVYVELLILYELWAGERPAFEKAVPRIRRSARPISVSAVPFGPGIDIWRTCRFLGGMIRALGICLEGWAGLCLAVLVQIIAVSGPKGWEKCGHGLTSGPRESSSVHFLDELLVLLRLLAFSLVKEEKLGACSR